MTLLVIEIKIASHELVASRGLAPALAGLWPSYLAFVTSFPTILVIWVHADELADLLQDVGMPSAAKTRAVPA